MGTIDSLIEGSKTLGFGPMAMMLVMVSIIVFSAATHRSSRLLHLPRRLLPTPACTPC